MRILLIEDDAMFGNALVRGLKRNGMTVDWTRDGSEGYSAMQRSDYALTLLDLGLPGMSGLEVLKAVRHAEKTPPNSGDYGTRWRG